MGECMTDISSCAVSVIGIAFDDDSSASRAVAFVGDFIEACTAGSAEAFRDSTLVISLEILVVILARMASVLPFLRLIFSHLECPDIVRYSSF